jgi:hypothetical protein
MENKDGQKSKRFSEMTAGEKIAHIGKVIVFFFSFGFAFPNIFSD